MTTETLTLAEFLLARIAEDETCAKASVDRWSPAEWREEAMGIWGGDSHDPIVNYVNHHEASPHIARWDPARVLAECEAKRRIVERYGDAEDAVENISAIDWSYDETRGRVERAGYSQARHSLLKVLLDLALPYADHESFKEEWRV